VRDKVSLTQQLVSQLPDPEMITVDEARRAWWMNLRRNGGMRLTAQGYHAFRVLLNLAHYDFEISDPHEFNQQMILALDRKLKTPYYISAVKGIPKKLIFFGSKEAVMANLYGDLKKFLDNY
jgi:hypothetical protein